MRMKKTTAARIFWVGAGICVIASGLYFTGMIPLSVCAAVLVPVIPRHGPGTLFLVDGRTIRR